MAFSVTNRVRVVDQSSGYRNHVGTVKAVDGDAHQVRLEGHGCNARLEFLTGQLRLDTTAAAISYAQCSS